MFRIAWTAVAFAVYTVVIANIRCASAVFTVFLYVAKTAVAFAVYTIVITDIRCASAF